MKPETKLAKGRQFHNQTSQQFNKGKRNVSTSSIPENLQRIITELEKYNEGAANWFRTEVEKPNHGMVCAHARNLNEAFAWARTPQGRVYWADLYDKTFGELGGRDVARGGDSPWRTSLDFAGMFGGDLGMAEPAKRTKRAEEPPAPAVTWDDVKGQEEAKRALREAVEFPLKFPGIYKAYKKKPSKGVLLYGPPGCGKTMLGKAVAGVLGGGKDGFKYIKGAEVKDAFVGKSEENVRNMFEEARKFKKRTGVPQVIFCDEADAFLAKRGGRDGFGYSKIDDSIVASFLAEVDGIEESGAFIILATNQPDMLDPAVVRDGRIDRKVRVDRPGRDVVREIIAAGFEGVPVAEGIDIVGEILNLMYAGDKIYQAIETDDRGIVKVCFHHTASGAMAAGLVEKALACAINRDIAAGSTTASGVTLEDARQAVEEAWRATWDLDNVDVVREVCGDAKPLSIKTFRGRQLHVNAEREQKLTVKVEHKVDGLGSIDE